MKSRFRRVSLMFHGITQEDWRNMLVFTSLETFAVGWIDVTYVFKYGCFVTMMTGNVVQMGRSLALEGASFQGAAFYLVLIFTFWCGVMSFRVMHHFVGANSKRCFSALFLCYYALYVVLEQLFAVPGEATKKWPVIFLPPMYGVHAALMLKGGLGKYPGIAMTSNSVNVNYFLFEAMMKGWSAMEDKAKENFYVLMGNFTSMCLGACCSALWFRLAPDSARTGELISLPPVLILVCIMLWNDSFFEQDTMDIQRKLRLSEIETPKKEPLLKV